MHITSCMHHHIFHSLELIVFTTITIISFSSANLTGLNQDLYRDNTSEVAQHLLTAIQNPTASLKQWNIISIWSMDTTIDNTFAKWYCTYGAARISPEFFPFIDEHTQQRTWWWNAVDRCKNASDTWYKIWLTPSQWALIVYNAWGKFWTYGHVGKVVHYDKTLKKIIVRDMARVGIWSMTDRREDLTTANVECYIYNSKTPLPVVDIPTVSTGTIISTWTTLSAITGTTTPTADHWSPTTTTTIIHSPTTPSIILSTGEITTPSLPVVTPVEPSQPIVTPTTPPVPLQDSINKILTLDFTSVSDMAKHFITQNDITLTIVSKSPLHLWEVATLTMEIKDKNWQPYDGLLPFSFMILSTNDNVQANVSTLQMITNGSVDISLLGQKIWTSSIVINMDDTKIGEFTMEIQ